MNLSSAIAATALVLCSQALLPPSDALAAATTPAQPSRAHGNALASRVIIDGAGVVAASPVPSVAHARNGSGPIPADVRWSTIGFPPVPGDRTRLLIGMLVLGAIARRRLKGR